MRVIKIALHADKIIRMFYAISVCFCGKNVLGGGF